MEFLKHLNVKMTDDVQIYTKFSTEYEATRAEAAAQGRQAPDILQHAWTYLSTHCQRAVHDALALAMPKEPTDMSTEAPRAAAGAGDELGPATP
eukprot:4181887-Alexandrium_andersonii.AAC.1